MRAGLQQQRRVRVLTRRIGGEDDAVLFVRACAARLLIDRRSAARTRLVFV
jgi:hypothetical protein